MVIQIITYVFVGLMAGLVGALLALRMQHRYWKNIHAQHEGWEHAQEGHHRNWEVKQELLIAEAEARFAAQVQQLHQDWQGWEVKDRERIAAQARQQQLFEEQVRMEHELARLPRVEETPIGNNGKGSGGSKRPQQQMGANWRPARLQGANLEGKDFSYRYLGRADLRNANLAHANLFMADLSGASLADADLTNADLSGANLSHADLRNALLEGANLLVADLNNTILTGADVLGARNLTTRQLYSAIYDSTTLIAGEIDVTMPRIPSVRLTLPRSVPKTDLPVTQDSAQFDVSDIIAVDIPSIESVEATPVPTDLISTRSQPDEEYSPIVASTINTMDNMVYTDNVDSLVSADFLNNEDIPTIEQAEQQTTESEGTIAEQEMVPETPVSVIQSDISLSPPPSSQELVDLLPTSQTTTHGNGNKSKHQPSNARSGAQNGNGKNNSRVKYHGRKRAKVS